MGNIAPSLAEKKTFMESNSARSHGKMLMGRFEVAKTVPVVKPGNGKKQCSTGKSSTNCWFSNSKMVKSLWRIMAASDTGESSGRTADHARSSWKPRQVGWRSWQRPVAFGPRLRGWQGPSRVHLSLSFGVCNPIPLILLYFIPIYKYLPHRGPQDEQNHYQTRFSMGMCHTW